MPRAARVKSISGIYHIIMRGINRQTLFKDKEDYIKFVQTLERYKEVCGYKLYAYCLMGNHVHLLLKEDKESLGTIMRRICGSYVLWYNKKYDRVGYLFQGRFKSEPVEDGVYFLTVLRYIFQNPLKANLVTEIKNYVWSNYTDYVKGNNRSDVDFVLNIFNKDKEKAVKSFIDYINQENNDECLEISQKQRLTDNYARKVIKKYCKISHETEIQKFDIETRNMYIKGLKEEHGLSIRQIERLTGIGRGIIQRV